MTADSKKTLRAGAVIVVGGVILWLLLRHQAAAAAAQAPAATQPTTNFQQFSPQPINLSFQSSNPELVVPRGYIPLFGFIRTGTSWG